MMITAAEFCTSNLTEDTMFALALSSADTRNQLGWPSMTVAPYDFGVFCTIPGHDADPDQMLCLPKDLHTVLGYARDLGATLIRFDKDAEPGANLPTYDW